MKERSWLLSDLSRRLYYLPLSFIEGTFFRVELASAMLTTVIGHKCYKG